MRIPDSADHSRNAFDLLRFLAAFAVLFSHSFPLYGLREPFLVFGLPLANSAVYMFFVISGFLVYQSWDRDADVVRFAARRALRLLPALVVVVLITVFIVGPVMTTLPLAAYFRSADTWRYMISNASLVTGPLTLPGVFETNPYPLAVNGSLWTLTYEVLMYAILAAVGAITHRKTMRWVCLALLGFFATGWTVSSALGVTTYSLPLPGVSRIGLDFDWMRVALLGTFFFAGSCMYGFRDKVQLSVVTALVLLVACGFARNPFAVMVLLWVTLSYASLVFAYRAPAPLRRFGARRDLSYGTYIYAFPVQQIVSPLAINAGAGWWVAFAASAILAILLAALSWHYIEQHALSWKPRVPQQEVDVERVTIPTHAGT